MPKKLLLFVVVFLFAGNGLLSQAGHAAEQNNLEAGMINPGYEEKPEWFKNSFLDIGEDVEEATAAGKRVMVYFYQDGCPYCAKLLRDNFSQQSIVQKARKYLDVIAVNMWGDREVTGLDGQQTTEKQFAAGLRVMFTPTILMLNEQGEVVLRINGYYHPVKFEAALDYVGQHKEKTLSFAEYYRKLAPVKASGKLHDEAFFLQPPYELQQLVNETRPLLVLFEQHQCKPCDEYHADIYQRQETREQLQRFNIVRLDMWAETPLITPAGKQSTAREFAKQLDVKYAPSMIFFDNSGKEVFRSEAYLRAFHIQSILDYVASGAYQKQPNFQRFIAGRADKLEAQGVHVDLWK
ncbi:MAG: thioredoxin fold domain-containing protein [Gammaproteobacteria bacterium]|nr:thioredoxin fold domain-containing protein [Gammaproteobacteria bacterium]